MELEEERSRHRIEAPGDALLWNCLGCSSFHSESTRMPTLIMNMLVGRSLSISLGICLSISLSMIWIVI